MRLSALLIAAFLILPPRPAAAAMGERCRWPPAGGTPVEPASIQVITHPVVGDLDGDGLPEIAFLSFADRRDPDFGINGILRVISGATCSDVITTVDPGCVTCAGDVACGSLDEAAGAGVLCSTCGLALADLDDDGFMEIIGLSEGDLGDPNAHRRLVIFNHLGQFVACSPAPAEPMGYFTHPAIADLDGDGAPEIVGHSSAFEADGSLRFSAQRVAVGLSTVADVDVDGSPEVVLGERVLRADGSILWDRPDLFPATPAVADLDGDCLPEIVLVTWHQARVTVVDGATGATRATTLLPGGLSVCTLPRPGQGGPPALADVDGDCLPEIGVAGCMAYSLFHFDPGAASLNLVWANATQDVSSRTTSSTFFDLDGDGRMEALYNDEHQLYRFDGGTGAILDSIANSNFTLVEYPTVADVDADGAADIVIPSNDYVYCCDAGVRVIADASAPWVWARPLQNQHSYHVTNILDDGTIPTVEEPSWSRGNDFRSQSSPGSCERPCSFVPSCTLSVPPVACSGPRASVRVLGAIQQEDVAGTVAHQWSSTCPNAVFDDPTSLTPLLEFDGPPPCPRTCLVTLTLTTGWGDTSSCTEPIVVRDDSPPSLAAPADLTLECDQPIPPPATVTATDACDPAPSLAFDERRVDGSCAANYQLLRSWTATDACGNSVTARQTVTVRDTRAPSLSGVPGDVTVECGSVPPPPPVTTSDACDPAPALAFDERRVDGSCAASYQLLRSWTATDACGNSVTARQTVTVRDTRAPSLSGVPGDVSVECGSVPPPPTVTTSDACDPAPSLAFDERRVDGSCAANYQLLRSWTATDACGNSVTARQTVTIRDTRAPSLSGVPGDVTVECGSVPPPPPVTASDACDPAPSIAFTERRVDGGCPGEYQLLRAWTAVDACGNAVTLRQTVSVVDTTPPLVTPSADPVACLWPPNHWYVCLDRGALSPEIVDNCGGAVTWSIAACSSDQPDDANGVGDGQTVNDCVVLDDGSGLCARSERDGIIMAGRHYGIAVVAVDACGNASPATVVGTLYVPHDQDPHERACLNPTKVGCRPNQDIPCR